jgi:predicted amidophosphoribosyltransferase
MMEYADPAPDMVVLFDDVLTTGSHFKGIETALRERFPGSDGLRPFSCARRAASKP